MAIHAHTSASNNVAAVLSQPAQFVMEDIRRAREFYRYLQPDNLTAPRLRRRGSTFDVHNEHVPSLSTALAPFCQLSVLRCNATKAMLNVIDRETMYFLAEASRTKGVDAVGEEMYEFVEDPILMSCSAIPMQGRICELTVRLQRSDEDTRPPMFVIPDLTESQFSHMSIVTGPPYYRFYAGVPISTRDGINIGSLAVMDTRVRSDGLTRGEEDFLATTADQIMIYLETNRQAIEGRRSRRMAEGLEAFIAGRKSIREEGPSTLSNKTLKKRSQAAYGMAVPSDGEHSHFHSATSILGERSRSYKRTNSMYSDQYDVSTSEQSTDSDERIDGSENEKDSWSHEMTFARAANLLRECLGDLGEEGEVRFVSLNSKLAGKPARSRSARSLASLARQTDSGIKDPPTTSSRMQVSQIMSCSTQADPMSMQKDFATKPDGIDDDMLRQMMKRYPGGSFFSLDEHPDSSSEETTESGRDRKCARRTSRRKQSEIKAIRTAFPSARQVLFAPLWDATAGAFAHAVFVATSLETRSFSSRSELSFLNSFCSTLMAECSRLDTIKSDRQKSDFVGTISHEMRSPLHGVLASVEFLADTDISGFQKSLVDTIDSCGRTLLDTINHVLDFSKVNSFQKQWQAANQKSSHSSRRNHFLGPNSTAKSLSQSAPPLLQLFAVTDVSCVLEEVVDGLVLGHTYTSGIDITDVSREARGRGKATPARRNNDTRIDAVDIFLDIQEADWAFITQPGAVRRIIMNITGNAIKYTSKGSISIRLRLKEASDSNDTRVMIFTVTDTGKGISQDFISSRLFVPFAQENALAPGTGLGLSIVRSIVLMLGGTIDVQSRVGVGTVVEVALPMQRPLPGQVSTQTTPHSNGTVGSGSSLNDDSIVLLQNQAGDSTITFYQRNPDPTSPLAKVVQQYVRDWYRLEFIDQQMLDSASLIIVEEEDLEHLVDSTSSTSGHHAALVVLCSVTSRHSASLLKSLEESISSTVEFVARPCGPHKLARSICLALEKKRAIKPRFPQVTNLGVIPEAVTPVSISPALVSKDIVNGLHQLDLNSPGSNDTSKLVQANETFFASQNSQNAQMAITDPSAGLRTPRTQVSEGDAFPFPSQQQESSRKRRESNRSISYQNRVPDSPSSAQTADQSTAPAASAIPMLVAVDQVSPRVLLVDDNNINLKLLETFLKSKRKYTLIERAEDGQQAVDAVVAAREPFDIIFMDISMPVLNGFEATRAIRDFEDANDTRPGAMVIALTGLASGRDQSEGFDSGCDIYMTKPVSFKEVGKLLDNWEAHQKLSTNGELAHLELRMSAETNGGAKTVVVQGMAGV